MKRILAALLVITVVMILITTSCSSKSIVNTTIQATQTTPHYQAPAYTQPAPTINSNPNMSKSGSQYTCNRNGSSYYNNWHGRWCVRFSSTGH